MVQEQVSIFFLSTLKIGASFESRKTNKKPIITTDLNILGCVRYVDLQKRLDFYQEDDVICRLIAVSGLQSMYLENLKLSRSAKGVYRMA